MGPCPLKLKVGDKELEFADSSEFKAFLAKGGAEKLMSDNLLKLKPNAKENGASLTEGGKQKGTIEEGQGEVRLGNDGKAKEAGEDKPLGDSVLGNGRETGVKHEKVNENRAEMGLPLMEKQEPVPMEKTQAEGREIFQNENMDFNVHEWSKPGTTINAAQQAALELHIADLDARHNILYPKWEEAVKNGDASAESLRGQIIDLQDRLDAAHRVAFDVGSEAGRMLVNRRINVDKDMQFTKMIHDYKIKNNTTTVPPEAEAKIRELSLQYEEANKKLKESLERETEKDIKIAAQEKLLEDARKNEREKAEERKQKRHQSKDEKIADSNKRKEDIKKRISEIARASAGKLHDFGGAVKSSLELADAVKDLVNENIKQAFEEGKVILEDIIDKTYLDIKDIFNDITKRDIMQIYSDYGIIKANKLDDYQRAKAEIKSQSFYKSATEDAKEGNPPYRRSLPGKESPQVRAARQEMEEAMKNEGIKWDDRPLEERRKSALDKAKQTIKNAINDLNEAVQNNELIKRKRDNVKLDPAAEELLKLKKEAQDIYDEFFGDKIKEVKDEQKVRQIQKRIDDIERKIKNKDFSDKQKQSVEDSHAVKDAKDALNKAREEFIKAREEADPEYNNRKRDQFLENFYNKQKEKFNEKAKNKDFSGKQKKEEAPVSNDTYKAWRERNAAKEAWEKEKSQWEYNKSSTAYKVKEKVLQWVRSGAISRVGSIIKIAAMAAQETALGPVDRFFARNVTGRIFPKLAKESWEAQKIKISDEVKAISSSWADIRKQAFDMLRSGKNSVDVYIKGEKVHLNEGLMRYFGNIHMIEKALVKNPTHKLAFERILQMMKDKNPELDINNLMVQHKAWAEALKEANRKILLGDNKVVDLFKRVKASGKDADFIDVTKEFLIKFLTPVVKVPTNYMLLSLDRTYGLPTGVARYGADLVTKGFDGMKTEEKQRVFRMMNNGLYGAGLFYIGWKMYENDKESIGTLYVPGVSRDQKIHSGQIGKVPSLFLHNPRFAPFLLGATSAQVFEQQSKDFDSKTKDFLGAIYASSIGIMEQNPFAQTGRKISDITDARKDLGGVAAKVFANPLNPGIIQEFSEALDNYKHGRGFKSGNEVGRAPEGFWENVEMFLPVLRENVPTRTEKLFEERATPSKKKTDEEKDATKEKIKAREDRLKEEAEKNNEQYVPPKSQQKKPHKSSLFRLFQ